MNEIKDQLLDIDVIILAGGLGTRLQPLVSNRPKCLALINGKTFIDILLDSYIDQGFSKFIICVGYLHEQIVEHLNHKNNCEIVYSIESYPLGTGGAIKQAMRYIISDKFIVANGDSICSINHMRFLEFHNDYNSEFTMVLTKDCSRNDVGNVTISKNNQISSFQEKNGNGKMYINSGIYLLNRSCLKFIPQNDAFSLEYNLIPSIIEGCRCYGFVVSEKVYDIGTPKRLLSFKNKFHNKGA